MGDNALSPRREGHKRVISIVGAGPAGLACAIVLARADYPVIVREQQSHVGGRFHGDFQGLENWSSEQPVLQELAEAGIDLDFPRHAVSRGVGFDAWGARYEIKSENPLYYLVRRGRDQGSLDESLLKQALGLGVNIRFGDRVKRVDGGWVCFDNKLAPLGYAYLLVHGGRGTVASCMFTDFKREAEYVTRTVATFKERVGLTMRNERRFGGYANFRLPRTAMQGGHLVIGEQAGFQDALAGFGMGYALRSGILAARSIIEDVDYTALWRRELLPLLKTAVSNRFIFNSVGEYGWRWVLAHRLQGSDARDALRRLYGASSWTRLLFPIAYLRYRTPLKDKSCDHQQCSCVWCRCAEEEHLAHNLQ